MILDLTNNDRFLLNAGQCWFSNPTDRLVAITIARHTWEWAAAGWSGLADVWRHEIADELGLATITVAYAVRCLIDCGYLVPCGDVRNGMQPCRVELRAVGQRRCSLDRADAADRRAA